MCQCEWDCIQKQMVGGVSLHKVCSLAGTDTSMTAEQFLSTLRVSTVEPLHMVVTFCWVSLGTVEILAMRFTVSYTGVPTTQSNLDAMGMEEMKDTDSRDVGRFLNSLLGLKILSQNMASYRR